MKKIIDTINIDKKKSKYYIIVLLIKYLIIFYGILFIISYFGWNYYMNKEKIVKVPDLIKLNVKTAIKKIHKLNLNTNIIYEFNNNVVKDNIIRQLPKPNRSLKTNRVITLFVSKGTELITVPDVRNLSIVEALKVLNNITINSRKSLLIDSLNKTYSNEVPAGYIITQTPLPGELITVNEKITLLVSNGKQPNYITLPDLVGGSIEEAEIKLKELNLQIEKVPLYNKYKEKGLVLKQQPAAGKTILEKDIVKVYFNIKQKIYKHFKSKYVIIDYTTPHYMFSKRVKIIVSDVLGERVVYNRKTGPAKKIYQRTSITGQAKVRIYIDGRLKSLRTLQ